MGVGLVLLANSTTSNKVVNEDREAWPPEIMFNDSLSAESSKVAQEG